MLLLSDENPVDGLLMDRETAGVLCRWAVEQVRRRYVAEGVKVALGPAEQLQQHPQELAETGKPI